MTCIIGIQKNKNVWLGGDSAGTAGDMSQMIIADKKVFVRGEFAFGVCGLPKVMDALNHEMILPKQSSPDDRQFMGSTFIQTVKETLKKAGCVKKGDGMFGPTDEHFEGAFLIGYRGKLYRMESNFQIITSAYGFDAVGSGADIALGHLHSTQASLLHSPKRRILKALEASSINNAAVRPPFSIVKV